MWSDGIKIGLKYWLVFFLGFAVLGAYPPSLSLILSALGAIAGGLVGIWWTTKMQTVASAEANPLDNPWRSARQRLGDLRQQLRATTRSRSRSPALESKRRRQRR